MTRVKTKTDLSKIITSECNLRLDEVQKVMKDKTVLNKVGKEAVSQIQTRTRLGEGVEGDGNVKPLEPLKSSTTRYRQFYRHNLSQFTTYSKSNLTATGQLLDSITYRINLFTGKLELYLKNARTLDLSGKRSRVTNNELLEYVSKDRYFFDLADYELRSLQSIIFQSMKK